MRALRGVIRHDRHMADVVAHGAGSSPDVAQRAFPGAVSFWLAGHGGTSPAADDGATDRRALASLVAREQSSFVAGISYGAHQVARWAAAGLPPQVARLALVMPAWTGSPGPTAAATAAQADEFARVGIDAALRRITNDHPGWVADALAASWPLHDREGIVAALHTVASSTAPSEGELASIGVPTTIVALADDPLHPAAVAQAWAELIPRSRLLVVTASSLADLGTAARS
jgi:pimeloyl-ACP methyl ester carboxylesterase